MFCKHLVGHLTEHSFAGLYIIDTTDLLVVFSLMELIFHNDSESTR